MILVALEENFQQDFAHHLWFTSLLRYDRLSYCQSLWFWVL